MKLFPAIDIKGGECVRLKQGVFSDATVYSKNPVMVAREFESMGASFIHLVDLDGSTAGYQVNAEVIMAIASEVSIPVELGGGIRSLDDIKRLLDLGVYRCIIGTMAVEKPEFVADAIKRFGTDHIVVGLDAKNGFVATHGWEKVSTVSAVSLGKTMKEMGVKTVIYTDISKDGMLSGPNFDKTKELMDETGLDIVASGGISSIDDLKKLDELGIYGAVMGKAIYEKKIDLREACALFR